MSNLTEAQINARESFLGHPGKPGCPIIGIVGHTGTGKTTFLSALMAEPRYRRVLFIDGDRGGATIAHLTAQPGLCEYRYPEKADDPLAVQQWLCSELAHAHRVPDIGAVIVEGVARQYEDLVGDAFAEASPDSLKGNKLRQLYIVPAGLVKAVLTRIGLLQSRLQKAGRAVPIFFTCNTKRAMNDDGKTWQVPNLSDAAIQLIQGRADAFVELTRTGSRLALHTDRTSDTSYRKVRHHGAAVALAKLQNPNAVTMIQTWADAIASDASQVEAHLSQQPQQQ